MSSGDRLLYAISARGEMSWTSVKRAFDCLHEGRKDATNSDSLRYRRGETVRMLESLGHVEFDAQPQRMRVVVTPPAIAVLPGRGLPVGVLTGARSPGSIERLSAGATRAGVLLDVQDQSRDAHFYPSRISFAGNNIEELMAFAEGEGLYCASTPSSWSILHLAGSLDAYVATLVPEQLASFNWEREDFDPSDLCFSILRRQDSTVLSRYTHPSRRTRLYVLVQADVASVVEPDWGRFEALRSAGRSVLAYDEGASIFAIPSTVPLPKLFARALSLCSGFVPTITRQIIWPEARMITARIFRRVPLSFAQIIAGKLGQQLAFRQLDSSLGKKQHG